MQVTWQPGAHRDFVIGTNFEKKIVQDRSPTFQVTDICLLFKAGTELRTFGNTVDFL